ncbi:MAG: hypothetical protein A2Y80_00420 [Deltaproteobacteria bacterium RBG_13_58_19]|nr:MAG: hypothetical protein A2Y80_00420 [Deltaproteobacteria bacterium RBG_13_58_19]
MTKIVTQGKAAGFEPLEPALVRTLVGRIQEILPLPGVVNAILKAANDPYANLSLVSDIILKDQGMTAKVLKLINSAYYGLSQRVGTVSQAVSLLGLEKIKNLAMAVSLSQGLFRWSDLPFGRKGLWHHSQACGVATSMLAQAAGHPSPEEALIAGLLHDIAKALWGELFPERFLAALQAVHDCGEEPLTAEKEFLSVPHPEVGAWMLEIWQLPEILQQAVLLHHQTKVGKVDDSVSFLSQALYLGNQMAKLLNLGNGGHYRLSPFPLAMLNSLSLTAEQLVVQIMDLPQAFADFLRELELEHHETTTLNSLTALLRERPVLLLRGDEDPGPVSYFFAAFANRIEALALKDWTGTVKEPGTVVVGEGNDPGEFLARWQQSPPPPRTSLLLFSYRDWGGRGPTPGTVPEVHLLGPEWRLPEVVKALTPGKRS